MSLNSRRKRGDETSSRLRDWTDTSKAAERLAGHILAAEGFTSIDPVHPLGGPDDLKDIVCERDGIQWVAAVYFPNGDKPHSEILSKFRGDVQGAYRHEVEGFTFVTNQYLTQSKRTELVEEAVDLRVEVYHRERIVGVLNRPTNYGIRLEYLDIRMDKTEQLALFSTFSDQVESVRVQVGTILRALQASELDQATFEDAVRRLDAILSPLGSGVGVMRSPLDRLEVVLTRLEAEPTLRRLLESRSQFISLTPLERIEGLLDRLDALDEGTRALLGIGFQQRIMAPPDPVARLEAVVRQLDLAIDRAETLRGMPIDPGDERG